MCPILSFNFLYRDLFILCEGQETPTFWDIFGKKDQDEKKDKDKVKSQTNT